ncbi:MAG: ATP-dependent helicase [Verrucomicrobiota bacterium]
MARSYRIEPARPSGTSGIDYRAELNDEQLAAVTSPPGPALVIAGAGSGKTRTLTYRVAYLLDNGIRPDAILLLTFTNKAAREMLERVQELVSHDTTSLVSGTFHSFGARFLRRHGERCGLEPNFSILDREDQKDLMAACIAESEIDPKAVRFPKPEVLIDLLSYSQNCGEAVGDVLEWRYEYFAHFKSAIEGIAGRFQKKKLATNSADFDDLLILPHRLLREQEDLRQLYQRKFQFLLVDEYQDTNRIQSELVDLLAAKHESLMVVGDDAQSIYSWRGANFENILEFPKRYPKARVHKIETNYRSRPEILAAANAAIAVNTRQFAKNLKAWREAGENKPALVPLADTTVQAQFVGQRILELRDEGIELEEMAVLYRAHYHSMEIQMELTNRGIPFQITSGLRFFEQAHVKDVASYLRFAVNPKDEVSFKRIARMLPGIGSKTADQLWTSWLAIAETLEGLPESFSKSLLRFKTPPKARKGWEQFAHTMDELVPGGKPAPPRAMIYSVIEASYDDYMRSKFPNYDNRRQDLEQLMIYAEQFATLDEFLAQLSLTTGADTLSDGKKEQDKEAVTLSSVHQAKGLEWRVVFLVWLAEGMFPSSRVADQGDEEGMEEERRLFYVALTRAKDELYLTYPFLWPGSFSGDVIQRPSSFLEDIPGELLESWETESAW